eukprot:5061674-Prymnesium_polylepis.1
MAASSSDVGWRDVPRMCSAEATGSCTYREVALRNAPPRFTTMHADGKATQQAFHGSHVIRRVRIVTVSGGAVDGATGAVLARGLRFVPTVGCQLPGASRLAERRGVPANESIDHLAVFVQKFGDAYSHIFFQTLPQ